MSYRERAHSRRVTRRVTRCMTRQGDKSCDPSCDTSCGKVSTHTVAPHYACACCCAQCCTRGRHSRPLRTPTMVTIDLIGRGLMLTRHRSRVSSSQLTLTAYTYRARVHAQAPIIPRRHAWLAVHMDHPPHPVHSQPCRCTFGKRGAPVSPRPFSILRLAPSLS